MGNVVNLEGKDASRQELKQLRFLPRAFSKEFHFAKLFVARLRCRVVKTIQEIAKEYELHPAQRP